MYVGMCVWSSLGSCMTVFVWRPEESFSVVPRVLSILYCGFRTLMAWSSLSRIGWLAIFSQGSSSFCFSNTGNLDPSHHAWHLRRGGGLTVWLTSLCICGKYFTRKVYKKTLVRHWWFWRKEKKIHPHHPVLQISVIESRRWEETLQDPWQPKAVLDCWWSITGALCVYFYFVVLTTCFYSFCVYFSHMVLAKKDSIYRESFCSKVFVPDPINSLMQLPASSCLDAVLPWDGSGESTSPSALHREHSDSDYSMLNTLFKHLISQNLSSLEWRFSISQNCAY